MSYHLLLFLFIMTDHEARRLKVGGEVICEIW
ncbi:MAG TPA: 30S ribosomal protein S8 [Thermodesulfobacterium commune]|uniref:Small ribosomal subunit protein uS8 n=1 Tax=Thermodesulfobacterium commune TaxID=1741 RepID=A0A3B8N6D1_9BACT|nr:30S ribosomal protein S8 [Thermodesulfobacterium commune]